MSLDAMFVGRAALIACVVVAGSLAPRITVAEGEKRTDREAIADLIYCYAEGTDAIGDSVTNADPVAKGVSIYQRCLADDVEIRVWFPQLPFDSQAFPNPDAFPATAPAPIVGVQAYAQFVNAVNRGNGYTFTQHMMSNVDVTVQGRYGTLTSYLNATLVASGTTIGGPSKCVAVANGTYSANVKKFGDDWKITRLNLTLISFNNIFQSGAGC